MVRLVQTPMEGIRLCTGVLNPVVDTGVYLCHHVDEVVFNMTILEAMKSGRPFKRKGWSSYESVTAASEVERVYSMKSILADDWVIGSIKKELTADNIRHAASKMNSMWSIEDLIEILGLE